LARIFATAKTMATLKSSLPYTLALRPIAPVAHHRSEPNASTAPETSKFQLLSLCFMLREPQPCAAHLHSQWRKWRREQDEACKSTVLSLPEPVKPDFLQCAAACKKRRRVFGLPREREPCSSTTYSAADKHKKHVAFQQDQTSKVTSFHDINSRGRDHAAQKPTRPQSAREPERGTPLEARLQRYRANSDARLLLQERVQDHANDSAAAEQQLEQAAVLSANKLEVSRHFTVCDTSDKLTLTGASVLLLLTTGRSNSCRQEDSAASCTCTAHSSGWCCHC
jgi:hypothetical protein